MEQKVIINVSDLRAIANAIRERTNTTDAMKFDDFVRKILGIAADGTLYLLEDDDGNQMYATLVGDEPVDITATENDIRLGSTAVTADGLIVGEKEIPAYHTTEGVQGIAAGKEFRVKIKNKDRYNYTKMQAIICPFNSSASKSVAAEKVCINDNIYAANDITSIAAVTLDHDNKEIVFGITNDTNKNYVIRYFSYKEEI